MRDTQIRVPTRRASGSGCAAGRPLFATRGPSLALRSGRDDPGCGQGRIGGTGFKNQRGAKARGRDGLDSARPGPRLPCPPRAAHSRWRCPQGPPRPARPPARGQLTGCARRLPAPQPARTRQPPTSGGCSALSAQGAAWQAAESGGSERWTRGCGLLRGGRVSSETTESRLSVNCSPRCGLRAGPPRIPWGNAAPRRRQQEVGSERGSPTAGTWGGGPGTFRLHPRKSALREREEGASRRRDASPSGHHVLCVGATRVSPAQSGSSRKEDLSETRERLRLHPSPSHAAPWGVTYTQDQDIVGARGHGDPEGRVRREGRSGGAAPPV